MDTEFLYSTANLLLLGPGLLLLLLADLLVRVLHKLIPGGLRFVVFKGLSIEIKPERYGSSYYSWLLKRYISKRYINALLTCVGGSAPTAIRLLVVAVYITYVYFML